MSELENKDLQKKIEDLQSALNYERGERKRLSKELANQDDSTEIASEEEKIREKLKNGKSGLSDEIIDDIMESIGKSQARANVSNAKQSIEREIMELKRDPTYMDVEEKGSEIRAMMKKSGMSAEQAYWAVNGATKYSSSKTEEQKSVEADEQKAINKARTQEGYVESSPAGDERKPQYTAKERAIADALNISPEEAKDRSKKELSLDEILSLNKKYKKGE